MLQLRLELNILFDFKKEKRLLLLVYSPVSHIHTHRRDMDNRLELVSVKIMIQLIKSHNLLQVHNCSHKPFRQMVNKPLSLQAHNKHDKPIQLNNGADSLISTAYLKVVDLTGVNVVHYMKA